MILKELFCRDHVWKQRDFFTTDQSVRIIGGIFPTEFTEIQVIVYKCVKCGKVKYFSQKVTKQILSSERDYYMEKVFGKPREDK